MNTVGNIIKKKRLDYNLSIEDICSKLNITKDIVNKIENNEITNTPDLVFYIGHIRSYSNLLNLNSTKIINQFKNEFNYESKDFSVNLNKPKLDTKL